MLNQTLPEIYGFKRDRAFELLKLVEEAHKRYNDLYPRPRSNPKRKFDHVTPAPKDWLKSAWETDFTYPIKIDHTINVELIKHGQPCVETREINAYREITSSPYEVLTHLVFTQTVWSATDLRNGFKRKNLFGFIARHLETSDLYVIFRGTSNLGEWISNVKLIQQSYTRVQSHDTPGETHWGFRRTYDRPETYDPKGNVLWATRLFDQMLLKGVVSMRETIEKTLIKHCPPDAGKVNIYVAGHSLGGALATLATAHIKRLIDESKIGVNAPILYSFASPRVGDTRFAEVLNSLNCYRIANSEDLVPKIPLPTLLPAASRLPARSGILQGVTDWLDTSLDFHHVGLPLYFTIQKRSISGNHTLPIYFEALQPPRLL